MRIPAGLREEIAGRIGALTGVDDGAGAPAEGSGRIQAGSRPVFLKYRSGAPEGFFASEAAGLEALRTASEALRVPETIAFADEPRGFSWIALEWLAESPPDRDRLERFGRGLAALHHALGTTWGWDRDGFIGPLPQANGTLPTWSEFWLEHRLAPQLAAAADAGRIRAGGEWRTLERSIPDILAPAEEEGPSPLHGDLWNGNVLWRADGAALIDPSFHFGHREVDLAMMRLFGGFHPIVHASYEESWPRLPGYEAREAVYQLYYLLVHVNLFGASYVARTLTTLRRILALT